jgi:hypothetical protein
MVADRVGKEFVATPGTFADARRARIDRIADALESHLDLDAVMTLVADGALAAPGSRP